MKKDGDIAEHQNYYSKESKQKLVDSELCKAGTITPSWKAACPWH